MEYIRIGGKVWNVRILEVKESFNILDTENGGRVISEGEMTLDRIGTFYGHTVTFGKADIDHRSEFDDLFIYLSLPRNTGIDVELVHNQSTIAYKAYTSTGERKIGWIDRDNNIVNWLNFSCNLIPMKAQVTP